MPEVWKGQYDNIAMYEAKNIIEPSSGSGGVGKFSWYIPKFTAERNPLLLSYFGMTTNTTTITATFNTTTGTTTYNTTTMDAEENALGTRRLLAETFLRPQTWNDFCLYVSTDNCTTPYYDEEKRLIASSPPSLPDNNNNNDNDDDDGNKYFVSGSYHGHFAPTDDNDCVTNPTTCTGHIANPPCDWTTFVIPQAYYNQIPVTSSGLDDRKSYAVHIVYRHCVFDVAVDIDINIDIVLTSLFLLSLLLKILQRLADIVSFITNHHFVSFTYIRVL